MALAKRVISWEYTPNRTGKKEHEMSSTQECVTQLAVRTNMTQRLWPIYVAINAAGDTCCRSKTPQLLCFFGTRGAPRVRNGSAPPAGTNGTQKTASEQSSSLRPNRIVLNFTA
jgi:hypothetical protein